MRFRWKLLTARDRLLLCCLGAGLSAGAIGGMQAASNVQGFLRGAGPIGPREAPPVRPAPRDALGEAYGHELAAAVKLDSMADCMSIKPEFQAGCRRYVQELARKKLGRPTPEDW